MDAHTLAHKIMRCTTLTEVHNLTRSVLGPALLTSGELRAHGFVMFGYSFAVPKLVAIRLLCEAMYVTEDDARRLLEGPVPFCVQGIDPEAFRVGVEYLRKRGITVVAYNRKDFP
ncbi:MAG TPA: hypothetical protein PLY16_02315 [Candidatus Saccharibacteria bacterium]|nr:hypothetical protein [Candidatus Saccharibacteria bacterium]